MIFWNALNGILFWILAWLLAWNATTLIFNKGVPNIRTAPAIRKKIIQYLKEDRAKHSGKHPSQ